MITWNVTWYDVIDLEHGKSITTLRLRVRLKEKFYIRLT